MQFKYPEILYTLFALLIPLFIHLFQLQRFTKTPFTNLKFLKEIEQQTRKSSRLKKLLLLLMRMGTFAALIMAFAQPYFSKYKTSKRWHTAIYLDNSYSMQAKAKKGEMLKRMIHDITENLPEKGTFSLITNNQFTKNNNRTDFIAALKKVDYTANTKSFPNILLQAEKLFSKNTDAAQKLIYISDFQHFKPVEKDSNLYAFDLDIVPLYPQKETNLSIDTALVKVKLNDQIRLEIQIKNQSNKAQSLNLSALQNQVILAKNHLNIPAHQTITQELQLPADIGKCLLKIDLDDAYLFDNNYYLSIGNQHPIKVMSIGRDQHYLKKIFTGDEFIFTKKEAHQVDFTAINEQNLISLEMSDQVSENLLQHLNEYVQNGGSLLLIPDLNIDKTTWQKSFDQFQLGEVQQKIKDSLDITQINFSHPLVSQVFERKVENFQFPTVYSFFKTKLIGNQDVLSFENQEAFLSKYNKGNGKIYLFSASIETANSNFTQSPLIVPIIYNMALQSVKYGRTSYTLGEPNEILIREKLDSDEVLHLKADKDFIPLQQMRANDVLILLDEQPDQPGFYEITRKDETVQTIAFNLPKTESELPSKEIQLPEGSKSFSTINNALNELQSQQDINSLFKYFILLSLLFIIFEILIIKYL